MLDLLLDIAMTTPVYDAWGGHIRRDLFLQISYIPEGIYTVGVTATSGTWGHQIIVLETKIIYSPSLLAS